jgi:tetratricopeptide (TPR) repeat protein
VDWQLTDEDATHGTHSLRLQLLRDSQWMHANLIDPDWQFRDLGRFSELSMDVRVESPTPQHVAIDFHDEVNCGHGLIEVFSAEIQPGAWRPIVYRFDDESLKGRKDWTAFYFDGAFRTDCVSRLHIRVWEPELPVTLYVDNLRLAPRELAAPANAAPHTAIHQPTPVQQPNAEQMAAAEASYDRGLGSKRAGRFQEAAQALRQAIAAAPEYAEAHWALAWVLIELEDQAGAKQAFRRVIELAPGSEHASQAQRALGRLGE